MKYITQDKFHGVPTPESRGNCQQAATASIFGLEIDEVPDFIESKSFWKSFEKFCADRGFEAHLHDGNYVPEGLYLAYGPSPRGVNHACIYRNGDLEWDPHPSRAGLLKIETIHVLVPFDPSEFERKQTTAA